MKRWEEMNIDRTIYTSHLRLLDVQRISFDSPRYFSMCNKKDTYFFCYAEKHSIRLILDNTAKSVEEGGMVFGWLGEGLIKIHGRNAQCFLIYLDGKGLEPLIGDRVDEQTGIKYQISNLKEESVVVCSLFEQLLKEKENHFLHDNIAVSILGCIVQLFSRASEEGGKFPEDDLIEKARRYLQLHYNENVTLTEVANAVSVSTFHLSHLFKEKIGSSPIKYVIQCRMDRAKEMLRNEKISISEVALSVGYDNPNYFSMLFKKMEGISPAAYRKEYRKNV